MKLLKFFSLRKRINALEAELRELREGVKALESQVGPFHEHMTADTGKRGGTYYNRFKKVSIIHAMKVLMSHLKLDFIYDMGIQPVIKVEKK